MSQLSELFFTLSGLSRPTTYIETGCYEGLNLQKRIESGLYREIHSIELDSKWFDFNKERFKDYGNVFLHNGDSAILLKEKWAYFGAPKVIFLDAHYSGPGTARGKLETPLLQELSTLNEVGLDEESVVIIDDVRMLGVRGLQPGNGRNYHPYFSDWSDITMELIKSIMGDEYYYLTNHKHWLTDGLEDQLIIFKTDKVRGDAMNRLNELIKN